MKRNPLIPFATTAIIGILLMIGMSFYGVNKSEELAAGETEEEVVQSTNPEEIYQQSCVACHGSNLEGTVGPSLQQVGGKLSVEQINDVIVNGQGSMPGGLVSGEQATILAEWLAEKK